MPEMTNMKLPPRKAKTETACAPCMPEEQYPYGLRLHLDTEQLEQLGIDKLPATGVDVMIMAKATVTSVHESATDNGGEKQARRSVALQITDLMLKPPKEEKKTEDVFYGGKEAAG